MHWSKEVSPVQVIAFGSLRTLSRLRPRSTCGPTSFEASIQNVLDLQDDASRAIANAIQVKLSPQEKVRLTNSHPVNPQAYDAYLQGQFFAETPHPDAGEKATEYFEQAIRDDPAWSLPYSGLARDGFVESRTISLAE